MDSPYSNFRVFDFRYALPSALAPAVVMLLFAVLASGQEPAQESATANAAAEKQPSSAAEPEPTSIPDGGKTSERSSERFFAERVLPILRENCFDCHSHESGDASGQLLLDSLVAMESGGSRGSVLDRNHIEQSLLLRAVQYEESDLQMPPDGKLPDDAIATIEQWLKSGANVPEAWRGNPEAFAPQTQDPSAFSDHWAYQPPRPWQQSTANGETAVDAILSVGLKESNLQFSDEAARSVLIRRLYFALLGLKPTFEQVEAFASTRSVQVQTYDELVDELLDSPHFGERWARHWMDVARYADNKGYVFREDREYPKAYEYRDWLIKSFNQDLPMDEFIRQQLAADLIAEENDDNLPALGFLTLGRRFLNNKQDIIDDRIDVVSRGLMGMTLACARCHDHKYDPLSQKDYYALYGVFMNCSEPKEGKWAHQLKDAEQMRDSFVLLRGKAGRRGDKVPRRFVSFLSPDEASFPDNTSGRLELAAHIASADNPLTARVIVNRVWLQLTGASLVESPSDFGIRCPPPRQLALLDHLATQFIDSGWSLKSLIKEIVCTRFYRQTSTASSEGESVDPTNSLYWRMNRRRLDFESMRDSLLQTSGNLDPSLLGPSVRIETKPFTNRRTVYAYIDRQNLPSIFRTFDMASPDTHSPRRAQTSVPQQGLFMLNSDFVAEQTRDIGDRAQAAESVDAGIGLLFRNILGRNANERESKMFADFIQSSSDTLPAEVHRDWEFGFATWNANASKLETYQTLEAFTGDAWQAGPKLPDPTHGWCMLNAKGGHPGNDLKHAVVRRFVAPRDGLIRITGNLEHKNEQGDGVRGHILAAGDHLVSWSCYNKKVVTDCRKVAVQAGDFIDFVTDCRTGPSHDSFQWPVNVFYIDKEGLASKETYNGEKEFRGPAPLPLTPWQQLAQVLMASNELAFVD
ncbi:MAG: PSD1 and planctomycete cytochrome C domain-containing protein [Aureliella sp.]